MTVINQNLNKAKALLEAGNVVAIPTETVYGLAANALDGTAIEKIFAVKNRPKSNPLIVHISDIDQLVKYTSDIPALAWKLAEEFWPGALTLLLKKKPIIPDATTSGSPYVAVRIPDHPKTIELLRSLDFPLAAPSANPFGYISPTRAEHVFQQLGGKIPMILDGGPCKSGLESTIVGFQSKKLVIHRQGYITEEMLQRQIPKHWEVVLEHSRKTLTPGRHNYHYAPLTPMSIVNKLSEIDLSNQSANIGVLSWSNQLSAAKESIILSEKHSLEEAAQFLYAALIKLDQMGLDHIYCEKFPDNDLGKTINERLKKASRRETNLP